MMSIWKLLITTAVHMSKVLTEKDFSSWGSIKQNIIKEEEQEEDPMCIYIIDKSGF